MPTRIRPAGPQDAHALRAIYALYIDSAVTFETELPGEEAFRARVTETLQNHPWLVSEQEGRILGYAYAHFYSERAAYRWSAELSCYLLPQARGQGLGERLTRALIAVLRLQGVCYVCGGVVEGNPASLRLQQKLGMRPVGVLQKVGYKNGRWLDVHRFEQRIAPDEAPPVSFIPYGLLAPDRVEAALSPFHETDG